MSNMAEPASKVRRRHRDDLPPAIVSGMLEKIEAKALMNNETR